MSLEERMDSISKRFDFDSVNDDEELIKNFSFLKKKIILGSYSKIDLNEMKRITKLIILRPSLSEYHRECKYVYGKIFYCKKKGA